MLNRKNLLTAALTSASLAALAMPTSAWANAGANVAADCSVAVEVDGNNPEAVNVFAGGIEIEVLAGQEVPFATQCGIDATASGFAAVAVGNTANADSLRSVAVGGAAAATARNTVALGSFTTASGLGSTAIGDGVTASGALSIAIGASAVSSGGGGVALGALAKALNTSSVAIGTESVADENLTVSFGRKEDLTDPANQIAAITRRLTNISEGIAATDAATVGQLNVAVNNAAFGVNPFVGISTLATQDSATFGEDSIAIGAGTNVVGIASVGIGTFASANGLQSSAFGFGAFAGYTARDLSRRG